MADVGVEQIRQAGWVEPVKYDYDTYNANQKELEAAQKESDPPSLPAWAANATKYEWSDEYGDVGPAHLALEEMLFGTEEHVTEGEERHK